MKGVLVDLNKIKKMLETIVWDGAYYDPSEGGIHPTIEGTPVGINETDAKFVGAAPEIISQLVSKVERLQAELISSSKMYQDIGDIQSNTITKLKSDNAVMKEVLSFYAYQFHWTEEYVGGPRLNFTGRYGEGYEMAESALKQVSKGDSNNE